MHTLFFKRLLWLTPISIVELSQPGSKPRWQLFDSGEPLFGQIVPDPAKRGIFKGVRGQPASPFREAAEQAAVHKLEEPAAIDLQGPQAAEQLLALIHFSRRKTHGWRSPHHIATGGWCRPPGGSTRQQIPTDRRPHQSRQGQCCNHRPETAFSALLPLFGPTQAARLDRHRPRSIRHIHAG